MSCVWQLLNKRIYNYDDDDDDYRMFQASIHMKRKSIITRGSPEEEKEGYSGEDLQKRKVLSLEWKSEWVTEYEIIVSMTVGR